MSISDKTRKVLWGRSGNRCAMCRQELVVDATELDPAAVIGDECHIISAAADGPRYTPTFPADQIDQIDNLILMCRVHHKVVDDQAETYTAELLRTLKANHETWVRTSLTERKLGPPRIRRIAENIPSHLVRLETGQGLLNLVSNVVSYSLGHDEPHSEAEVEQLAAFLQEVHDHGEISGDMEAGDRVKASFHLGQLIKEIEAAGFWVFGARETQRIEGGLGDPEDVPVAIVRVLRSSNPEIIKVDLQPGPGGGSK